MRQRYNSFGSWAKRTFGAMVQKVNVDAGFTCPNRDGTLNVTGCTYCNNESFKPGACRPTLPVGEQVRGGIAYLGRRYGARKFLAYFQAYTNTYAPVETLESLYREALAQPSVVGLAVGTRPDCVDEEKLALLEDIARESFVLLEYGLQSIHDKSLRYVNRGHDYACFLRALDMTRGRGIHVGAHTIVGFPTESREETLQIADEVSHLGLGFLKIHQLQVIEGTPLAENYRREPFPVLGYEEFLDFLAEFIERLSPGIVLQRLFATAPDDILIAPRWGRSRHRILRDVERRLRERDTWQGKRLKSPTRIG
ncbi:MAG: TIGR01212 family radical SAM protein [Nitrospirota bacterium]|jgi:radical SAM protein (TIGR01212 family)